jgi:hypothetical protein
MFSVFGLAGKIPAGCPWEKLPPGAGWKEQKAFTATHGNDTP